MTTFIHERHNRDALLVGIGLALVWLVAATIRPSATFHLAPILVAGSIPLLTKTNVAAEYGKAALLGFGLALLAGFTLALLDLLRGPSLLPVGGALLEAIVFAFGGAIAAFTIATLRR
jgi:hypothetical protein